MKHFLVFIVLLIAFKSFSQVEILEGSTVYKCGADTLILHASDNVGVSDFQWFTTGVPFPFYFADSVPLSNTYSTPQRTVIYVLAAKYFSLYKRQTI